jgi:hypothetical protein
MLLIVTYKGIIRNNREYVKGFFGIISNWIANASKVLLGAGKC